MRALFIQFSKNLKSGRYIFVAKKDILELNFSEIQNHFKKNLRRANVIEKIDI
jgi:ribonuclease P protein component